jgi:hypothetical protein
MIHGEHLLNVNVPQLFSPPLSARRVPAKMLSFLLWKRVDPSLLYRFVDSGEREMFIISNTRGNSNSDQNGLEYSI